MSVCVCVCVDKCTSTNFNERLGNSASFNQCSIESNPSHLKTWNDLWHLIRLNDSYDQACTLCLLAYLSSLFAHWGQRRFYGQNMLFSLHNMTANTFCECPVGLFSRECCHCLGHLSPDLFTVHTHQLTQRSQHFNHLRGIGILIWCFFFQKWKSTKLYQSA